MDGLLSIDGRYLILGVAVFLICSLLREKGRLLSIVIMAEFLVSAFTFWVMNYFSLWGDGYTYSAYYIFYISYALKDLFLIIILSKIQNRFSLLACLAFFPSMLYHLLTISEFHAAVTIMNTTEGIEPSYFYFDSRTEFMSVVCCLQLSAMFLAIFHKDIGDGGKYISKLGIGAFNACVRVFSNSLYNFGLQTKEQKK